MASANNAEQSALPSRTSSYVDEGDMLAKSPPLPDRSQSMSVPRTPNRRQPPPLPLHPTGDFEAREEMWARELEEARTRLAQMEKTMRWWCDCTASWREKWSKVRNERNKSRDECKRLRSKLETFAKDCSTLKKEKEHLASHVDELKVKLEDLDVKDINNVRASGLQIPQVKGLAIAEASSCIKIESGQSTGVKSDTFVSELLSKSTLEDNVLVTASNDSKSGIKQSKQYDNTKDNLPFQQNISVLSSKLDDAQRIIQSEREEKITIMKSVDQMTIELASLKTQQEELKSSRSDVMKQLLQLKSKHQHEMGRVTADLEDEYVSRSDVDAQLADLRKELERLQAENAQEWGKRERLESEKLSLERDNKKLRSEVENLEEDLMKKNKQTSAMLDGDLKTLQFDMAEKNKELSELRHGHNKIKKLLQEKVAELEHSKSRTDQYEVEVRKLRTRVDELKQGLATAEDEVDQQANQIRRLQRTNDELQVQCENLQVQVEHLQTRLRSSSNPMLAVRASSLKKFSLNDSLPTTDEEGEDK